jgi:hypothetical protein
MARIALILRYQWRAHWRRFIRTRQHAQFYFTVLALLGWLFFVLLPPRLSQAARELAAGQTSMMEAVLVVQCALWLFALVEDSIVSLTSTRLHQFPLGVRSLLVVRVLSLFCSPVALLIAAGSIFSLWPLFSAHHPGLAVAAALLLFALVLALGMSASHVLSVSASTRTLLALVAIVAVALGAIAFAQRPSGVEPLRAAATVFTPPHLVTMIAVAATPSATVFPFIALIAISVPAWHLLVWSFRRSLFSQTTVRAVGRTVGSPLWFPGRWGGLVRKEQFYVRKLLDLWPGALLVLAVSVASLFGPLPPIVRQSVIVIVFASNVNAMMNCFGLDTPAELSRYFILPLRGRHVLLIKNLGLTVIVMAQLALLILIAAWRSGPMEAGAEIVEAMVLMLSHLSWGNLVSVTAPFKMQFYRFASSGEPLTMIVGTTIGSAPGVLVVYLLHSATPLAALAIGGILVLVSAAYLVSLHLAGKDVDQRRHILIERLS